MVTGIVSAVKERHSSLYSGAECRRVVPDVERDFLRLSSEPLFKQWRKQIEGVAGCEKPVYLAGRVTRFDGAGMLVRHYDTVEEPNGRIAVRCRNRRKSQCAPCSRMHSGDSFQIVRSGVVGGKGIPASVVDHPQVFLTLTAPSFGAVHSSSCRTRSFGGTCRHGRMLSCTMSHGHDDPLIGSALCGECYDYSAHVLWHAHVGELWNRTMRNVRRGLAEIAGIARERLNEYVRLTFVKVAEYQRRGAVHFHAVMRLDGASGAAALPPAWATVEILEAAIRDAVRVTSLRIVDSPSVGNMMIAWGRQIDIRDLADGRTDVSDPGMRPEVVASYLAKYVSKSVGDAGGIDSPIRSYEEIRCADASLHVRALMGTCWRLGGLVEFAHLRLRAWVHTLGYRGHVLTKSPGYSTTYGKLRGVRAEYVRALRKDAGGGGNGVVVSSWRYVGRGYSPAEDEIARGVREDLEEIRLLRKWGLE